MASNKPKTITVKDLKNLKNAEDAFVIKERIGAGTYGEVFTAMHKDKAKMVAIKAMNLQPDEVHEIVSEVNTLSQYSDHSNIARYFGCYIKRGPVAQIWIAMEYCAGGSIFDLIKHGGNNGKHYFKEEWIAYASREILEGLKYLHSMKVIHRDIKGQNILLTDKAEVKLVDFGVSAKLDKTVGKRCTFIGTPYWMAPEVIECEKDPSKSYTFECDIWSTGITAMEMAEGKPPLNDLHPMTALFKIPSNEPPKLKNPRDWSDRFKDFLKQCLKKNYKQRSTAEELLSTSRFVKAVNSERAQVELRQAIERVHRTKGHSRKLQRDMILRPDEGTNLEDSDEDNPETIKTIREQFKKMDNKAPVATPFVPQAAPPQVVSSQVSHVAPPFHQRLQNQSAQQVRRQQDGVDINIRKMYEKENKEDRGFNKKTNAQPSFPVAPTRSSSQHNGIQGNYLVPRKLEESCIGKNTAVESVNSQSSPKAPLDDISGGKGGSSHCQNAAAVPMWRPAVVTNASDNLGMTPLSSVASKLFSPPNELTSDQSTNCPGQQDRLKRKSFGTHLKQASEPAYSRQASEPPSYDVSHQIRTRILPDRIPLESVKGGFSPINSPTGAVLNLNHVASPTSQTEANQQTHLSNLNASDRKQSAPPFSGPMQPVAAAGGVGPNKDDIMRKNSVQGIQNSAAPNVPKSTVFSNPNAALDGNKRNSKNLDHMSPLAQASAELLTRPASAATAASANLRRHPNDPTPEFPRKVSANVNQTPSKSSSANPTPRKPSEQQFHSRPNSMVKDLRQHPISRQNAPLVRNSVALPSSSNMSGVSSVANFNDRPLPAQPPTQKNVQSSSGVSTSQVANVIQLQDPSNSHQSNQTSADNLPKGVWARPSKDSGGNDHSPLLSSQIGKATPLKLEDIDRSPGARRKSYASKAQSLVTASSNHDIAQSKLDNASGGGYAQLRLDGAITDSSSIDSSSSEMNKTSTQQSFPYVDSDQESTLNKPATVRRNNYSFEDSFTSCFNNSSYSNSEEERRKFAMAAAAGNVGPSADHGNAPAVHRAGPVNTPMGRSSSSTRNQAEHPVAAARSNDSYSVSGGAPQEAVKHWQRNIPAQQPPHVNSVSNSEYISAAPQSGTGNHHHNRQPQQQHESLQQQQIKVKGAVINPDYGSNVNAFSNDQYGLNPAVSQDLQSGRRFTDDLGISNQAYDSSNNFPPRGTDTSACGDYESLANATQAAAAGPIYANQLQPVVEHEQRAPIEHPEESGLLEDDSGVYSTLAPEPLNGNGTYERLYERQYAVAAPSMENSNGMGPQPLPRKMATSREGINMNVGTSSGSSEEAGNKVSMVTAKASLVTPHSLSPTASQVNLNGASSRDLAHASRIGSTSSNSLTDDTSLQHAVSETPLEDDLSEDSDREQADNFGTILVSSKPKPIQSDGRVPQSEERNALGGFRRGGSVKESSSKKVLHATSAGDLNSDSGSKHNQQPLPTQSHPQGSAGGALLTKGHKKGSTASVQQVEENNSNKHARKSSGGRSKSQERPAANNHSHVSVKKRNGASGSGHASEEMEGVGKMDASKRTENGSVDINENLRKSKDGRSGKSMEDVSNKRFSIASPSSAANSEEQPKAGVVAETPRRVDQIKRESVASSCSPLGGGGGRSRKGSGSSNEHKNSSSSSGQFNSFGFGAGNTPTSVNVPINITSSDQAALLSSHGGGSTGPMNPEIRKFLKKFKSEVLCACLWGVNLLIGTTKGLYFMDRSGGCEVVRLVNDRKFMQMEIIPSLSLLVTISGKNNRLREYYLKVLQTKIIKSSSETPKVHDEYGDIGNKIENCNSFKIVKYDAIRFLVVAYRIGIIVLAWAPKPCHKFMAVTEYKDLKGEPLFVNVAIREADAGGKFVLKVVYATNNGFHVVDDSGSQDIFIPTIYGSDTIKPHCIMTFPKPDEPAFLLCYNSEGAYVTDEGKFFRDAFLQWGEAPIASVAAVGSTHIMGWATNAIEFRSLVTGQLDGVFMQRNTCKMRFLCECNDKVFFASYSKSGISQIYLLTLNHQSMIGSK